MTPHPSVAALVAAQQCFLIEQQIKQLERAKDLLRTQLTCEMRTDKITQFDTYNWDDQLILVTFKHKKIRSLPARTLFQENEQLFFQLATIPIGAAEKALAGDVFDRMVVEAESKDPVLIVRGG